MDGYYRRYNRDREEDKSKISDEGDTDEARSFTQEFREKPEGTVQASPTSSNQPPGQVLFPPLQRTTELQQRRKNTILSWENSEIQSEGQISTSKDSDRTSEYLQASGSQNYSSTVSDFPGTSDISTDNQSETATKSQKGERVHKRRSSLILTLIDSSTREAFCGRCQTKIEKTELQDLIKVMYYDSKDYANTLGVDLLPCEICSYSPISKWKLESHLVDHAYKNEAYCSKCRREISTLSMEPTISGEEAIEWRQIMTSAEKKKNVETESKLAGSSPPHCANCGVIFDYIAALVHKIMTWIPQPGLDPAYYQPIYICKICKCQNLVLGLMKQHILAEIRAGNVLCRQCQNN